MPIANRFGWRIFNFVDDPIVEGYAPALWDDIEDVAVKNLHAFEYFVGDMTDDYGMPEIDRQNINKIFGIYGIWMPKQADSNDDCVGLLFGSEWENEHGMHMLLKNGEIVWHGWDFDQWYFQARQEQIGGPKPAW